MTTRSITIEQLQKIATQGDFFALLEGVRLFFGFDQGECTKTIGLTHTAWTSGLKNRSYKTFSRPNLDLIFELFATKGDKFSDAKEFIDRLLELREDRLSNAESRADLITEITNYAGMIRDDIRELMPTSDASLSTYTKNGTLFTREKSQTLIDHLTQKHPELQKYITATFSEVVFLKFKAGLKEDKISKLQQEISQLRAPTTQHQPVAYVLSVSKGISVQPTSFTLSM